MKFNVNTLYDLKLAVEVINQKKRGLFNTIITFEEEKYLELYSLLKIMSKYDIFHQSEVLQEIDIKDINKKYLYEKNQEKQSLIIKSKYQTKDGYFKMNVLQELLKIVSNIHKYKDIESIRLLAVDSKLIVDEIKLNKVTSKENDALIKKYEEQYKIFFEYYKTSQEACKYASAFANAYENKYIKATLIYILLDLKNKEQLIINMK